MDAKVSEWRPGPNVCRCCFTEGCYKDISTEYFWMGKREVYAEMLSETFDLSIAYSKSGGPNSNSRLICENCIARLRDATDFKRQVKECEKTFIQHLDPGNNAVTEIELRLAPDQDKTVKLESVKLEKRHSDDDFDDRNDFATTLDDDDDDLDDQPLLKLASKTPKKESENVDILDLLDNAKVTEKRKSSTKNKEPPTKKLKKKEPLPKPSASKSLTTEKKKKGTSRTPATSSIWEMTVSERQNAATFLEHTTIRPFVYCRYYFKCFFCQERYSEIRTLLEHTSTHVTPDRGAILKELLPKGKRAVKVDISRLKCKICNETYFDLDILRDHLNKRHGKEFTASGNGLVAYNLEIRDGQFSCHVCSKIFQTFILLNRHMNVHFSNAICEICGVGFMTHQRLMQHREIHYPGGYPCDRCEKVYTTSSNLRYHVEKAHEGTTKMRLLRCPHCPDRFVEHFRKLRHLKEAHNITFTFECEICKATFPTRRSLTMHTNKFHTQKTQCEVCKKSFSCRSVLKKHMLAHSGERNYVCPLCQKAYRHEKSLKQHLRVHGPDWKFSCSECGSGFANRNDFNKHVKEWHPRSYYNFAIH